MGLIRLIGYVLLGYVAYELYAGMSEGGKSQVRQSARKALPGRSPSTEGSKRVAVQGSDGGTSTRRVGRGVTSA